MSQTIEIPDLNPCKVCGKIPSTIFIGDKKRKYRYTSKIWCYFCTSKVITKQGNNPDDVRVECYNNWNSDNPKGGE